MSESEVAANSPNPGFPDNEAQSAPQTAQCENAAGGWSLVPPKESGTYWVRDAKGHSYEEYAVEISVVDGQALRAVSMTPFQPGTKFGYPCPSQYELHHTAKPAASESEVAANSPNPFFRSKEFQPTPYPELTRLYFLHDLLVFLCHHDVAEHLFWAASGGPDGKLVPYVNENDLFSWACCDATEITPENFEQLKQAFADCAQAADAAGLNTYLAVALHGAALFSCRVAQMRPQGAAYPDKEYFTALRPLFDACGPERPVGLGNPYAPGDYKPTRPSATPAPAPPG